MRWRQRGDRQASERARAITRVRDFEPTITQQAPAVDADINVLVKRFGIDRQPVPPAAMDASYYGEFDSEFTLGDAMNRVRDARERFMALPAALRARFDNSPAKLWNFVSDPANADVSVELGLLSRVAVAPPAVSPPAKPEAPSGA